MIQMATRRTTDGGADESESILPFRSGSASQQITRTALVPFSAFVCLERRDAIERLDGSEAVESAQESLS